MTFAAGVIAGVLLVVGLIVVSIVMWVYDQGGFGG
jgi:hypothetical protein